MNSSIITQTNQEKLEKRTIEKSELFFSRQYLRFWSWKYAMVKYIQYVGSFLLCAVDSISKYAWVVTFKEKKDIKITSVFQTILDKIKHKPNKT